MAAESEHEPDDGSPWSEPPFHMRVDHYRVWGLALGYPRCCIERGRVRHPRTSEAGEIIRASNAHGISYGPCYECVEAILSGAKTTFFTFERTKSIAPGGITLEELQHLNPRLSNSQKQYILRGVLEREYEPSALVKRLKQQADDDYAVWVRAKAAYDDALKQERDAFTSRRYEELKGVSPFKRRRRADDAAE